MKKFFSFLFTLIFAMGCNYAAKTYYLGFLSTIFPNYICAVILAISFLLAALIWVKLILRLKLKAVRMGKLRIKGVWIVCALAIPAMYFFAVTLLHGKWYIGKIDVLPFIKSISVGILAYAFIDEITLRSLILERAENAFGKCIAVIITSVVYVLPSVIYNLLYVKIDGNVALSLVYSYTIPLLLSVLLALVTLQSEGIANAFIIHIFYSVSENLINVGKTKVNTALLNFVTDVNPWILFAIKSGAIIIFSAVAILLLAKKKKEEVLYW